MARTAARPKATLEQVLEPLADRCAHCGRRTWADYENRRTVTTLSRVIGLRLKVRRCHNDGCPRYLRPCRPEAEGAIALPEHEFGLDVIALVGASRYGQHRSVPEVHRELALPGVPHHLCHFHYLREAGRPLYEMDRHAKKELKKRVRGVRPIERRAEGKDGDPQGRATRRYCAAVRSAITDDGRPPLEASGLKLQGRLRRVERSLGRLAKKGRPAAS